ncbi:hypothetical protein CcaverHIS002_0600540 [Cutaneotrichosporon cavernicola]|uniref:Dihydroorotate dehydrogenase (fumarate) n=1 Tax=Cutaneotrichosporon cavernicola TaxID=279322 RepID=A0AA48L5Q8_9TREE|nr:uncharacterized protein CcaverHIS019_0500630 [Cutaneotrichosporon cavernicola]BEI85767.1 hypothetical protein CcaverHIS002_0600540 [Cutaneotrichosporon cavernicola]BEI92435.1 hypothetical protein CcaverHIS019_0500630 [Cutaneotrichosporon cavernicola]BEJ00208.1 hypothetical protein CcaverHIS631_0500650 [Cutaneotrichosporon cavernicola]BEJ07979.1 hypothetical protein CcaverHIS641_0500640 [Cutaneotrichosporon cavernicola]
MPSRLSFSPPILNAACPWATDLTFLRPLYASPSTGAITTRTSLIEGYPHDDAVNTFLFFDSGAQDSTSSAPASFPSSDYSRTSSLNSFGLSPIKLAGYLDMIRTLAKENPRSSKPIIVSVTGTPESCAKAIELVEGVAREVSIPLAVELNLSCPNVPGHPPPAYYADELRGFLAAIPATCSVPVGLKTPPYTHGDQFNMLVDALAESGRVSFLTSTNTLGNCVVMAEENGEPSPVLPSEGGFGGMAGPAIHPLSLGNVASLRTLLDQRGLDIDIIGVGGVSDGQGYRRMRKAGAKYIAVATALGKQGPAVFDRIVTSIERQAKL